MRVSTHALWACAQEMEVLGQDTAGWLQACGLAGLDLVRPRIRPTWPVVAAALDEAGHRIGVDGLRSAGRRAPNHPIVERLVGILPKTQNVVVPYRVLGVLVSGTLFPVVTVAVIDRHLQATIHEGFTPCEALFHVLAGAAEVTPTFFGQGAGSVVLDAGPRVARLHPWADAALPEGTPQDDALVDTMAIRMLRATTVELDQLRAESHDS